jgi:pentatricopeptide repeat protein
MFGVSATVLIEEVSQVFMDVQTELIFFALAIGTHLLFFKGLKLGAPKHKKMDPTSPKNQKKGASSETLVAFKAALRAGDVKSAMSHFEALHGLWQQHDSPSSAPHMLMEQLVKLAAQNQALPDLLELVNKLGLMSKALDLLLAECASQGDTATMKNAEQMAREQGVKFTSTTYQALIKCAGASGTARDVQQVLIDAEKAGMADVATYNTYIKGLLKKGNLQEVRKVMDSMKTAGLRPNTVTFNGILSAAVSMNADSAWSIVEEMKTFNVKPDNVTCSILLKSITPKSKMTVLEKVYEIMDGVEGEMDEVLVSSVVEASVRVGRADLLVPFLKAQRASKKLQIKGAHTYGSIIRAYGYVQDIKGAWDAWHEMRKQHITPISVTLGCMVEALVTNGDIEGGYELIQEMLKDEKTASLVNAVMYGSIVKGFSHKKSFDRVWEVYEEMRQRKLQFSMVTYNTLIDACARSGELSRIPALLRDIEAQGLKMGLVTYSAILKGYCQTNRLDEAFELVQDMQSNTSLEPDEIMYNTLLDGCARQGVYDRGMALLEKMKSSGVKPSNFTLSVLVKLCNRGKKLEQAFEICEYMTAKHGFRMNVHVFDNLIQACINHRDLKRAIGVLEGMLRERVRPDVRTYSLLLRACIEERQPAEAAGLLRAAIGLRDVHERLVGYGATAMQPQGWLPAELISEIVSGILDSRDQRLGTSLFADLSRVPGVKLDPKLKLKFTARMAGL